MVSAQFASNLDALAWHSRPLNLAMHPRAWVPGRWTWGNGYLHRPGALHAAMWGPSGTEYGVKGGRTLGFVVSED